MHVRRTSFRVTCTTDSFNHACTLATGFPCHRNLSDLPVCESLRPASYVVILVPRLVMRCSKRITKLCNALRCCVRPCYGAANDVVGPSCKYASVALHHADNQQGYDLYRAIGQRLKQTQHGHDNSDSAALVLRDCKRWNGVNSKHIDSKATRGSRLALRCYGKTVCAYCRNDTHDQQTL